MILQYHLDGLLYHQRHFQQVVKYQQFNFTVLEIKKNRIHKLQLIVSPQMMSSAESV